MCDSHSTREQDTVVDVATPFLSDAVDGGSAEYLVMILFSFVVRDSYQAER